MRLASAVANAHRAKSPHEHLAIGAIVVANEIRRSRFPGERFADLARQPRGARVRCDPDPEYGSASDTEHDERKQAFKGQGGNDQKIYWRYPIRVVTQKRLPTLRRRSLSSDHVFRNDRLRAPKAKLQRFAMYPRRAPKRVFFTHASNKITQFPINIGPTARIAGLPAPPRPETRAMPRNDSLRTHDRDGVCDPRAKPTQPYKQRPITAGQSRPLRDFPPQDIQLAAKDGVFGFQLSVRTKTVPNERPEQFCEVRHRLRSWSDSLYLLQSPQTRFSEGTGAKFVGIGLVQLGGVEPPTSGSTIRRSSQLSYSCMARGPEPKSGEA